MLKIINHFCLFGILAFSNFLFGQSDTPCAGAGAPNLPVGTTCSFTTASTVGFNLQTNANNGGFPSCDPFIISPDGWFSFTAPASGGVTISTQAGSITDGVMALYSGSCTPTSLTEIGCNDDANGTFMPEITSGGLTPGVTYFIRIWDFDGFDGTMDICITETTVAPPPTNVNCGVPDPICSGTPINFTAQANGTEAAVIDPGNNYDCLFTSPNPSWYYLEIDTGGDLAIDITAGSDIDFAIWGPFTDLATAIANCNSYGVPVDCSYSPAPIEQANVNGVLAGEVYVLLVTNFANTVQSINLVDAPGNSALTDCSNVPLPVELAHFSGMRNDQEVLLNWTTATELNNDYFLVERSNDGKEWHAFDLIFGSGTTTTSTDYHVTDSSPFDDVTYYRLRQVDYNGNMNFSDIISVDHEQFTSLEIYPNPGSNSVTVRSERNYNRLTITDIHGKEIMSLEGLNENQTHLEVEDWKNGIYYVTLSSSFGARTERLTILR